MVFRIIFLKFFSIITITFLSCSDSRTVTIEVDESVFLPTALELERDSLVAGGLRIGAMAQRFYHTNSIKGGGGFKFLDFVIPEELAITKTGYYSADIQEQMIEITGYGKMKGADNKKSTEVRILVDPDYLSARIVN